MGLLQSEEVHLQAYYVLLMALNVTAALVIVAACLWCRKKTPKNELLGLEGMVKLKNPDDVVIVAAVGNSESQADLNASTTSNADSDKRASTAAHRSLPDIPVAETSGDDGSDLYETQTHFFSNVTHNLKKQSSISQHSSISQADDSPYSRVKNSPHDYAKVRTTEHPYAQLNAPPVASTSTAAAVAATVATAGAAAVSSNQLAPTADATSHRNSHHSDTTDGASNNSATQAEIPAASAIAGMVSASQDLPYMTPPITNQHFSGDSQDSSKGYTSISVREPLANILATQQPPKSTQRLSTLSRDVNDSHYATVSDDSDETYAAIEDPTGRTSAHVVTTAAEIYTSGSETYAQIQPMQSGGSSIAVWVGPDSDRPSVSNATATTNNSSAIQLPVARNNPSRPTSDHATPVPLNVDSLRAQVHSRQASSSSNNSTSCVGNLGSPKPEKRQANSPLPPTPKSNQLNASSNSNLNSGRNSVISVIECGAASIGGSHTTEVGGGSTENSPQKKHKSLSPSRDIEGMYAKVMKKAKFSRNSPSSQDNSPVLSRKYDHTFALGVSPLDATAAELMALNTNSSSNNNNNSRMRSNSYGAKDHGYETIPADSMRTVTTVTVENRKSDCYTHILQKERQLETGGVAALSFPNGKPPMNSDDFPPSSLGSEKHYETIAAASNLPSTNDPGYETLQKPSSHHHQSRQQGSADLDNEKKSSDYDPNYEVLKDPLHTLNSAGLSDDGYAKVMDKKRQLNDVDADSTDGYTKVKGEECEDGAIGGYSTIKESKDADANHNYASILETKAVDIELDHYARIREKNTSTPPMPPALPLPLVSAAQSKTLSDGNAEVLTPRLSELPSITSPSSANSCSTTNFSSANVTSTTSTISISSRQTASSSQYESLTGSDTDPNYESVCYLNNNSSTSENPYERLQPDYSDTQLSSPSASPLATPEERMQNNTIDLTTTKYATKSTEANGVPKGSVDLLNPTASGTDVVVDDYFQV